MIILCLNCGSSSVKYKLYDWDKQEILANGIIERLDIKDSVCLHQVKGKERREIARSCADHRAAIQLIMELLKSKEYGVIKDLSVISAVGHRVAHGGERFSNSVIITDKVLNAFRQISDLAPLHNSYNVLGIEAARELMPNVPQMAVIDTAWHQTMPKHVYMYALPYEWYENYKIRRYGFHGTSLLYVSRRAAVLLGKDPFECNLVICHIGNGVSLNAIKYGISYDTSMGFTPLEGLIMGTRAGDHDAAIDLFMMDKKKYTVKEMNTILNKKSGILGITSKYSDRRDVEKMAGKGDDRAKLAVDMESYRIKKYIGAYAAAVEGIDAVVFTAGVGEKSSIIRAKSLQGLEFMGIKLNGEKNNLAKSGNAECDISAEDSKVKVFVIPTDEERVFIEDVVALYKESMGSQTKYIYRFQMQDYRNSLRDEDFEKECKRKPELRKVVASIPASSSNFSS